MMYLCSETDATLRCVHLPDENPSLRYFNPSVAAANGRAFITLRASSFERSDVTGKFYILRPFTEFKNDIVAGAFDANLACTGRYAVNPRDPASGRLHSPGGFEDLRIVASPRGVISGMTCLPSAAHEIRGDNELIFDLLFKTRMGRIEFGPNFEITQFRAYPSPFDRDMEKNWAPFYHQGQLCVIYQWNPLIVLELHDDGTLPVRKWFDASPHLKGIRGGSPGIPFGDGFLFVVHRRFALADKLRFTHQLIELDADLRPRRISVDFSFLSTGLIEYCAGLARVDDHFLLTFGLNDSLPFVARIAAGRLERMLAPFPEKLGENRAILTASPEEQIVAAALDHARAARLSRSRILKQRIKEWRDRLLRKEMRG
jgi:hypothetical protein